MSNIDCSDYNSDLCPKSKIYSADVINNIEKNSINFITFGCWGVYCMDGNITFPKGRKVIFKFSKYFSRNKNSMNIFFFPLENYVRELDGRCSIISELNKLDKYRNKKNKFISIILPKNIMYLIHEFIFSSYSVLGMSLRKSMYGYAKKINKSKGSYYFLEEEYFDRFSDNSIRFGAQDQCKHVFASTKTDYESLKRKFPNRITFCGNPRIDVLNKIENLYENEILMLRNKYGRFFLFNSTFSFLNPPKGLDYKFLSNIGIFRSEKEKK